jgi:hypothetical protein
LGDSGLALQGLAEMFNNPDIFGCLPCLHNFTNTNEFIYSGFFIPAYRMHFEYLDDRGVTNTEKAREWFDKNRNSKLDNPQAFLEYCSEYCYTPDEALVRQGENQFNQILLAEQLANITIHKIIKEPERGFLMGGNDDGKGGKNAIIWKPNAHEGDILLLEEPERDENGNIIKNLYCAGIDSIDIGTNDSTGQLDVSDFCIVILRRQRGIQEPRIVAIYKNRPRDIRIAYDNAFRLLDWYNAKCVLENSRTNIITYAREKKKLHHFLTRPKATITNLKTNTTMIGAPPTEGVVRHYLELIEQFINDYYQGIAFVDVINELMKYTYENKRKFDIVASFGMCLLADEELFAAPIESVARLDKEWRDIGYYTGPDGRKHFGAIPIRQKIIKQELGEGWM